MIYVKILKINRLQYNMLEWFSAIQSLFHNINPKRAVPNENRATSELK